MSVIEVTTFRLTDGADEAAFLAADRFVQAELGPRKGFLRRTTARRDGGDWLVVALWASATDADASDQTAFEDSGATAFADLVDAAETRRYQTIA
jgi:hypothetical protein